MTCDQFLALALFAFVTSVTPGPNNMMLMASGANFGLARTVPHALGVALGFAAMAMILGAGLMQVFVWFPWLHDVLLVVSIAFMAYLAWKLLAASAPGSGTVRGTPVTFLQAAAFQWVNPKAWAMALTALSTYSADQSFRSVVIVSLLFAAINLPSVFVWVVAGREVRRWLTNPARLRVFNITMALLLLASLWPVVRP